MVRSRIVDRAILWIAFQIVAFLFGSECRNQNLFRVTLMFYYINFIVDLTSFRLDQRITRLKIKFCNAKMRFLHKKLVSNLEILSYEMSRITILTSFMSTPGQLASIRLIVRLNAVLEADEYRSANLSEWIFRVFSSG